jgi:hypothetical protein
MSWWGNHDSFAASFGIDELEHNGVLSCVSVCEIGAMMPRKMFSDTRPPFVPRRIIPPSAITNWNRTVTHYLLFPSQRTLVGDRVPQPVPGWPTSRL